MSKKVKVDSLERRLVAAYRDEAERAGAGDGLGPVWRQGVMRRVRQVADERRRDWTFAFGRALFPAAALSGLAAALLLGILVNGVALEHELASLLLDDPAGFITHDVIG